MRREGPQPAYARQDCPRSIAQARRHRADASRRLRRSTGAKASFDRMVSDFRTVAGDPRLRQRPRSVGDLASGAASRPPICRSASRPAPWCCRHLTRRTSAGYRDAGRRSVAAFADGYRRYFEANAARVRRSPRHARSHAAADARAGRRPVRAWPHAAGGAHRRRHRRDVDRDRARCRGVGRFEPVGRRRPLRSRILAARAGEARHREDRCRSPGRSPWSPAAPARSARRRRRRLPRAGAHVAVARSRWRQGRSGGQADRQRRDRHCLRRHRSRLGRGGLRRVVATVRRRRHRRLECRRRMGGSIASSTTRSLRKSFELNFFAHQTVAQNAVRIMKAAGHRRRAPVQRQQAGGQPGREFRRLWAAKAATLFLSRQYALEHGADRIRVNAVNADRIRSGLLTDDMIAERSSAPRASRRDEYMAGNLLGLEVTRRRRRPGLPASGARANDHRRRHHGRWRQHRRRVALTMRTRWHMKLANRI